MVYDVLLFVVVGCKLLGIEVFVDFEGFVLGVLFFDGVWVQFLIFVQIIGIDVEVIIVEFVGFFICELMLVEGEVVVVIGFSFLFMLNLKCFGVLVDDILVLLMVDYGFVFYGNVIIVNIDFVVENFDVVFGFFGVVVEGWIVVIVDFEVVVDVLLKCNFVVDKVLEVECFGMVIVDNVVIDYVMEYGMGGIDVDCMVIVIEQIKVVYEFVNELDVVLYFDLSFLFEGGVFMLK